MRAKLRDLRRHPDWAYGWWLDLPHRHLDYWRVHLFAPGAGWLRWGTGEGCDYGGWYEPPEPYITAPPLRRLWWAICWRDWKGAMSFKEDWGNL